MGRTIMCRIASLAGRTSAAHVPVSAMRGIVRAAIGRPGMR